jgi:hypothetical protein
LFGAVSVYAILLLRYAACDYLKKYPNKVNNYFDECDPYDEKYIKSGVWVGVQFIMCVSFLSSRDYILVSDTTAQILKSEKFDNSFGPITICHEQGVHFTVLTPTAGKLKVGFPINAPLMKYLTDFKLSLPMLRMITSHDSRKYPYPS